LDNAIEGDHRFRLKDIKETSRPKILGGGGGRVRRSQEEEESGGRRRGEVPIDLLAHVLGDSVGQSVEEDGHEGEKHDEVDNNQNTTKP